MLLNDLQRDTVLVTDVVGRVERAIAERWQIEGESLREQIDALRRRRVPREVIAQLHYLRKHRNGVIHHPRAPLADRAAFELYAADVLPLIEGAESADGFAASLPDRLLALVQERLEAQVQTRMDAVMSKLSERVEAVARRAKG